MTRYLVIRRELLRRDAGDKPGVSKYSERVFSDCDTEAGAQRIAHEYNQRDAVRNVTYYVSPWEKGSR